MADDIVLEILKSIQADVSGLKRDVAALSVTVNILAQDGRMIRAALADLGKTRVSAGEIEAIHADINSLLERVAKLEAGR